MPRSRPRWPATRELFLVAQLDPGEDDPDRDALYDLGVIATAMQLLKLPDGTVRVLVEGLSARDCSTCSRATTSGRRGRSRRRRVIAAGPEVQALMRSVIEQFENYAKLNKLLPPETAIQLGEIEDAVAARRCGRIKLLDQGLRQAGPAGRAGSGAPARDGVRLHGRRAGVLQVEKKIRSRVKRQMEKTQRDIISTSS